MSWLNIQYIYVITYFLHLVYIDYTEYITNCVFHTVAEFHIHWKREPPQVSWHPSKSSTDVWPLLLMGPTFNLFLRKSRADLNILLCISVYCFAYQYITLHIWILNCISVYISIPFCIYSPIFFPTWMFSNISWKGLWIHCILYVWSKSIHKINIQVFKIVFLQYGLIWTPIILFLITHFLTGNCISSQKGWCSTYRRSFWVPCTCSLIFLHCVNIVFLSMSCGYFLTFVPWLRSQAVTPFTSGWLQPDNQAPDNQAKQSVFTYVWPKNHIKAVQDYCFVSVLSMLNQSIISDLNYFVSIIHSVEFWPIVWNIEIHQDRNDLSYLLSDLAGLAL